MRTIGVSNFGVTHLRALLALAPRIRPAVNQVELHPYLPQTALRALCEAEGIRLVRRRQRHPADVRAGTSCLYRHLRGG